MRARSLFGVLAATLLTIHSIHAQESTFKPTKILIFGPESKFVDPTKLLGLYDQMRSLAQKYTSYELVGKPQENPSETRKRAGCPGSDAECLQKIGRLAQADQILFGEVQKLPGQHLVVVTLVDVASGSVSKQSRQRAKPDVDSLRKANAKAWLEVMGPLVHGQLTILTNVDQADVWIDGKQAGKTPLSMGREFDQGKHLLEVSMPGYKPFSQDIKMDEKNEQKIEAILVKIETAKTPTPVAAAPEVGTKLGGGKEEGASAAIAKTPVAVEETPKSSPTVAVSAAKPEAFVTPMKPAPESEATASAPSAKKPWYKQVWFWSVVGAVVAGGTVTTILLVPGGGGIPAGKGRAVIEF